MVLKLYSMKNHSKVLMDQESIVIGPFVLIQEKIYLNQLLIQKTINNSKYFY